MFYKIGFWVLLAVVLICAAMFVKSNPMRTTGAMSWAEMYSQNPPATLSFLKENFGITVTETIKTGIDDYNIIKTPGQMWPFAGVMKTPMMDNKTISPHTIIYITVKDYAAAHDMAIKSGAVTIMKDMLVEKMKFGIYTIPGGVTIGIVEYNVK